MIDEQPDIQRVVVVVPAHNEESVLDLCLASVAEAGERVSIDTVLVVVLDACSDSSASIAEKWAKRTEGHVVAIDRRNVGAARAAGFFAASHSAAGSDTWFATTDADSVVRPDWIATQIAHARRGASVVAGTVLPDSVGFDARVATNYFAGYRFEPGHRHIHGANLGMRADVYWNVGGFAGLRTGEDVDLVRRFEHAAHSVLYACDSPVTTSTRRVGRAPDGFAAHLRSIETDHDMAVAQ
nr:glycosyltransferase [Rhodococcus sp. (in: high G+C Gram-positive bacteria)]